MLFFMKLLVFLTLLSLFSKIFNTLLSRSSKFFVWNDLYWTNLFVLETELYFEAELRIDLDESWFSFSTIIFFYSCFGITVVRSFRKDFTKSLILSILCGFFASFSLSINLEKDIFTYKLEVFSWLLLFLYTFRNALQLFLMWGGS